MLLRGIEVIENIIKNQGYGKEIYGKIDSAYNFIDNPTSQGFEQFHHNLIDIVHTATEYDTKDPEFWRNAAEQRKQQKQKPTLGTRVKRAAAKVMLIGALLGLGKQAAAQNNNTYTASSKPGIVQKYKELTTSEIETLMKNQTVNEIIKKCKKMDYLEFSGNIDKTNDLKKKYICRIFKKTNLDNVLVFFYNDEKDELDKRSAIFLKELYDSFNNQIEFVAIKIPGSQYNKGLYDIMCKESRITVKDTMGIFDDVNIRKQERLPPIRGPPSFALYSRHEILLGETKDNNDGKIKLIDVFFGGPKNFKQIKEWSNQFPKWWLNPNIFDKPTPDKDGKLYRFNNTDNYQHIGNFKYKF